MEVMAESPGDVEYSTQYADAISMIAENESHGSREQEYQEGISLLLDVQNGADTDEHQPMSLDLVNSADAMDMADGSPGCSTGTSTSMRPIVGIATGNWGCGVFGGNLELKSLLQWLAASQAGRPYVLYFSFKNPQAKRLQEVADWILQEQWCVGELWSILLEYGKQSQFLVNLFNWIMPQPGTQLCSS